MLVWLVPIAVYWSLAATYLGGAAIDIQGGGAFRQLTGLLLHFASYVGIYAVARIAFGSLNAFLGVALPLLVASALLPLAARAVFRAVGVRIVSAPRGPAHA